MLIKIENTIYNSEKVVKIAREGIHIRVVTLPATNHGYTETDFFYFNSEEEAAEAFESLIKKPTGTEGE